MIIDFDCSDLIVTYSYTLLIKYPHSRPMISLPILVNDDRVCNGSRKNNKL